LNNSTNNGAAQPPLTPTRARSRSIDIIVTPKKGSASASAAPFDEIQEQSQQPAPAAPSTPNSSKHRTPAKRQLAIDTNAKKKASDVDVHTPVYLRHQYCLYFDEGIKMPSSSSSVPASPMSSKSSGAPSTPLTPQSSGSSSFTDLLLKTQVGEFDTVQAFWSYINAFESILQQKDYFNLRLFKKQVLPVWEHASNRQGGKWTITLPSKRDRQTLWQELAMAFIGGEQFRDDCVTGIILSARPRHDSVQLWVNRKSSISKEQILSIFSVKTDQWSIDYQYHDANYAQQQQQSAAAAAAATTTSATSTTTIATPPASPQKQLASSRIKRTVLAPLSAQTEFAIIRANNQVLVKRLTMAFAFAIVFLICLLVYHQVRV